MKENKELAESTNKLSESFDRFLQLLKELCEEVRKLKEKVVR
jgi:hypothetical protein